MEAYKKKVLILSMTGGFGHIRAGEALLDYAKEYLKSVHAEHIDISDIDTSLKKYSTEFYEVISRKVPFVWGVLYKYIPAKITQKAIRLRGVLQKKIRNYIFQKNPDIIIFTNTVMLPMFAAELRKKLPHVIMGVVVTDYHGHSYYQFPFVDFYFVAHQKVAQDLMKAKVAKEKIIISGIPINPRFYIKQNVEELKLKYKIENSLPVVVLIASFKISDKELILLIGQLLEMNPPVNLIYLANGNEKMYLLAKNHFSSQKRFLSVNWTNVIEEYIKMSDVVISKAGGLTVSECLTLKKQMIIVNPIRGQEEHNTAFVEENHFGKRVKNISEIKKILPEMLSSKKGEIKGLVPDSNPSEKIFQTIIKK